MIARRYWLRLRTDVRRTRNQQKTTSLRGHECPWQSVLSSRSQSDTALRAVRGCGLPHQPVGWFAMTWGVLHCAFSHWVLGDTQVYPVRTRDRPYGKITDCSVFWHPLKPQDSIGRQFCTDDRSVCKCCLSAGILLRDCPKQPIAPPDKLFRSDVAAHQVDNHIADFGIHGGVGSADIHV